MPIAPSQSLHKTTLVCIVSLPRKVRPISLPNQGSLVSIVHLGRKAILFILVARVRPVVLASLLFLFSLGSLLVLVSLAIAYLIPRRTCVPRTRYLPIGARRGPVEVETAGYQLDGGISYRALLVIQPGIHPPGQPTAQPESQAVDRSVFLYVFQLNNPPTHQSAIQLVCEWLVFRSPAESGVRPGTQLTCLTGSESTERPPAQKAGRLPPPLIQ